jgi:ATP-dependent exoDNAse (exonuclease V) alpha subunit
MGPTLVALSLAGAASVAHAQGTMDFSGAQTLMTTFKTSVLATIREGAESNGYAVEGFAPTSRAAKQLRDVGIMADTLQRFLTGGGLQAAGDPANKHLYMVDESSLASTQQMRDFLNKIAPQDKVLLIGDTRQHQGVDAGKPFEQLQEAGMRTAQLDQIMRQKDPELLKAVEHLSNNETAIGVDMLSQQGRITEIVDPQERIAAIRAFLQRLSASRAIWFRRPDSNSLVRVRYRPD